MYDEQGICTVLLILLYKIHLIDGRAGLSSRRLPDEQRLLLDLLENYDPDARPLSDQISHNNDTVPASQCLVTIRWKISKLDGIDAKLQKFTVSGWIVTSWYDKRLTWDPSEYGNIDSAVIPPEKVWLPRFMLQNSASNQMYEEDYYRWFKVTVWSDGEILWEPGGNFISKCKINVRYFPFDVQVCQLVFANWIYTGNLVNLTFTDEELVLEKYSMSEEWEIIKVKVWRKDLYYEGFPEPYPEVHYVFHLRRKPLYFIMNIIVPSIMLSVLVSLVFKLPPESGEKISMGVTLLLSFSVFILMISENVPATSDGVPIIVVYLLVSMGITCMTVGLSVFILCLHHQSDCTKPSKALRLLSTYLAKIIRHQIKYINFDNGERSEKDLTLDESVQYKTNDGGCNISGSNGSNCTPETGIGDVDKLSKTLDMLSFHSKKVENLNVNETSKLEWREIARVFDAFLFWVSLFVLIIVPAIILGLIPATASEPLLEI